MESWSEIKDADLSSAFTSLKMHSSKEDKNIIEIMLENCNNGYRKMENRHHSN